MKNVFFTSDSHYSHRNIIKGTTTWKDDSKCRLFNSVEEHNITLVSNINKVVRKNDILYHLGDWSFGGIEQIWEFRKQVNCENVHLILGNHDCFDLETEILTDIGWLSYHKWLIMQPKVASYRGGDIIFNYALDHHYSNYNGKMYHLKNRLVDLFITPNHRLYLSQLSRPNKEYKYIDVQSLPMVNSPIQFKVSGDYKSKAVNISDDMIQLIAWLLSDGSVKESPYGVSYVLYQSEDKKRYIEKLLDSLNISYKVKSRQRDISQITGKKLKSQTQRSYEFYILQGSILEDYIRSKYTFPAWLRDLNQKQFELFLDTYCLGDGSVNNSNTLTIYGTKGVLSQLQELCVLNNCRSILNKYRNKQYRLYVLKNRNTSEISRFKDSCDIKDFKGGIFCLKTPESNLIVRRNGKVCVVGNSHIQRNKPLPNCWRRCVPPFEYVDEDSTSDFDEQIRAQDLFLSVQNYKEIKIDGILIILSHFAMRVWHKNHKGAWMLYGYCHDSLNNDNPVNLFYNKHLTMDVGIDTHPEFRPYSFAEIKEIMNKGGILTIDHHDVK